MIAKAARLSARRRSRLTAADPEAGNAIIEFLFVAVLALVPLVYLILAVATVQHSRLAVTNAARDVGRVIAASQPGEQVDVRAEAALEIALRNEGLQPEDVQLKFVAATESCGSASLAPDLGPGTEFTVCVIRQQRVPALPSMLAGKAITVTGRYVVHIDDYRTTN